jgi:hypothetical protein
MAKAKSKLKADAGRKSGPAWAYRIAIEMGFIIFLFYSNLLMGEFLHSNSQGKSLAFALGDIFTAANFAIACVSALIGHLIFEFLRQQF